MASMLDVSRHKGGVSPIASWTVFTTNCMSSGPPFLAGPRLMSIQSTPFSFCLFASSAMGLGSFSLKAFPMTLLITLRFSPINSMTFPPLLHPFFEKFGYQGRIPRADDHFPSGQLLFHIPADRR